MKGKRRRINTEQGIALVVVLWVITLLSVMATSFAVSMRTEARLARNLVEVSQARYLAEAGMQRALLGLLNPDSVKQWRTDWTIQELAVDKAMVRVAILDETGKLDLNMAPPALLDGLFRVFGVEEGRRAALVDALLDWRDTDQLRQLNGAEDDDYRAAGLPYGAKDGPFEGVEELQLVLGMTPELFQRLEPLLTVHSRRAGVNPFFAPRPVLLALPGSDGERVDAYLATREASQAQDASSSQERARATGRPLRRGRTFTIAAEARLTSGVSAGIRATMRLDIGQGQPFSILVWKEGTQGFFEIMADAPPAGS